MPLNTKKDFGTTRNKKPDLSSLVYGKVPPQAPEAEEAVLGAIMLEKDKLNEVLNILKKTDVFYVDAHSKIYSAIVRLVDSGSPVDLLTVTEELRKSDELEIIGGAYYLVTLTMNIVTSANVIAHAHIILEKYMKREAIRIAGEMIADAYEDSTDVFDSFETAFTHLYEAYEAKDTNNWVTAQRAATEFIQHREAMLQDDNQSGISTTFQKLDDTNGKLKPGQLVIIAARPSVGKSAIASEIILDAAKQGNTVGVINFEMSLPETFGRMVSQNSGIKYNDIDRNVHYDLNVLMSETDKVAKLPIYFSKSTKLNIRDISAAATSLNKKHKLKLLVIDYLQLVDETDKGGNREQNVAKISRGLKLLAMQLGIPIIALCQLNRESEKRLNKRPSMADLRESGALEQDADIIMLLHRDWRVGITSDELGNSTEYQADLIVPKWRNGEPVELKLHFEPSIMKFTQEGSNTFESTQFPKANTDTLRNAFQPIRDFSQPQGKEEDPF